MTPANGHAGRTFARWLLNTIDSGLNAVGLGHFEQTDDIIYLAIVTALAFLLGWLIQKFVFFCVRKYVEVRHGTIGQELLDWRTLSRVCRIIPPLVIMAFAPFAFESSRHTIEIIERIAGVYALITFGIGLSAVFDFIFNHYNIHDNTRKLPIKGLVNIAKGVLWIVIVIFAGSVILDKSPAMLLTGLGAFAAALMLVFRDPILGFVAGIQMSQNDMLHVGDWILVPGTPANGIVTDVTLTAVKVRNFDNTIVTVPPYTLVSTSFQNYRGMKETGARRITRTLMIDLDTVCRLDAASIDAIVAKYPELSAFVDKLRTEGRTEQNESGLTPVNGTISTNIGLFRAYLSIYIAGHPQVAADRQILVRLMDATSAGIPMQLYCFAATTDWDMYEGIQSSLVEHVTASASDFAGLRVYSQSSLTVAQSDAPAMQARRSVADSADNGGVG